MSDFVAIEGGKRLPDEISYEAWIAYVFDHENPDWHWNDDSPFWDPGANPELAVEHITRLFSESEILIGRFSADQIGAGMNYIVSPSCSDTFFALIESAVPLEKRLAGIASIETLYRNLFSVICLKVRQAGRVRAVPGETKADYICFMFWDVAPLCGRTRNPLMRDDIRDHWEENIRIEAACLGVLERILNIDHIACQEAAIHGLGEWATGYGKEVKPTIDEFLCRPGLDPELIRYAKDARSGRIP